MIGKRRILRRALASALALALGASLVPAAATAKETPIPKVVTADGRHALLVDGEPFLVIGAQAHNSSAWPAMLPKVWPAMDYLGVNTVELPVYWEQIEPAPGRFDFTVVDTLIQQAREHRVRLVLLWFGTWKNGSAHYRPVWMKQQPAKYPNIIGRQGQPVDSPSPHAKVALDADIRAFSAFMAHLKQVDPQRTVIMVQVQNEPGSWGSIRDFSPAAEKEFAKPVPPALLRTMKRPAAPGGNWRTVFGSDADEYFHAWSVARYIDQA
jgi:beta-galactosidase GanA